MDSYGRLIPLQGAGVAAAAVLGWFAVPLVVLIGSACDRSGPLTVRAALAVVGRHPIATLAGLLIVPVGLAVPRSRRGGDHRPAGVVRVPRARPLPRQEIRPAPPRASLPPTTSYSPSTHPSPSSSRHYAHGLRLGYTLIGAVPASLPRFPEHADLDLVPAHL